MVENVVKRHVKREKRRSVKQKREEKERREKQKRDIEIKEDVTDKYKL